MPQTPVVPPSHIPVNKPSFNWEGTNLQDSFKFFKEKCNYLLVSDIDNMSNFLNWLGPKLYGILNHLVFPEGKSKMCTKKSLTSLLCVSSKHRVSHNHGISWVI